MFLPFGSYATGFVRWILDNLSTFIPIKVDKLSNLFKGNSFGSFIPFCRYKMKIIVCTRSAPDFLEGDQPCIIGARSAPKIFKVLTLYIMGARSAPEKNWGILPKRGTNNKNHLIVKDPRGTNNKNHLAKNSSNLGFFQLKGGFLLLIGLYILS